jgi:hypothetical protein
MKQVYQSQDGKVFDTAAECRRHEAMFNAQHDIADILSEGNYDPRCSDCAGDDGPPDSSDFDDIASLIIEKWTKLCAVMNGWQDNQVPTNESIELPTYETQHCSICDSPQFMTDSGITCHNGHGGAPSK